MPYGIWYLAQEFGPQALSKRKIQYPAINPVRVVNGAEGEFHKEATCLYWAHLNEFYSSYNSLKARYRYVW